jgi:hypothetical protein
MNFTDMAINYYLRSQQLFSIYYRLFWFHVFNVKELKAYSNNQTFSIIWRYFIFNILTKFVSLILKLRSYVDITVEKVHVTKITSQGDKTIILEKSNDVPITLETISNELHDVKSDETMLNCILINFDLVNSNNEKICLKEYAIKYKDLDESYQHTLKNIFVFNDIAFSDDSKIAIRIAKNKKISTHELLLKEVHDKHINYFINL